MQLNLSSAHSSKLVFFDQLGSTNQYLLEQAGLNSDSWPDQSVVCAGHQTAGRGRNDRQWESPAGASLASSVLIRNPSGEAHWYGILVAMSLAKSLRSQGVDAGLKWPNDVLVNEQKIAGVLSQAANDYLVVGIGINLRKLDIEGSISIAELKLNEDFDAQLAGLLSNFSILRKSYEQGGVSEILEELRGISHTLGLRVRVRTEQGVIEGVATNINQQGKLEIDHGRETVFAGDILHLRGVE
jgi:BirA family biotin operon repressor/biotin-[acetyl-CoA-carboxylase] ligase